MEGGLERGPFWNPFNVPFSRHNDQTWSGPAGNHHLNQKTGAIPNKSIYQLEKGHFTNGKRECRIQACGSQKEKDLKKKKKK